MTKDDLRNERDATRAELVAKLVEDALWRFNDDHEDTISVYDVLGAIVEDLMRDGLCPACLSAALNDAFERTDADRETHVTDADTPRPGDQGGVFH